MVIHATLPKFPERLQELPQFKGKYTGKIVGGEPVEHCSHYPYQVSVQRKSLMTGGFSHFCGGSIISENYVLTAGHCVNGRSASAISVVVGTHKLDAAGREGSRRNAKNITVHEKYSSRDVDYDLALIQVFRESPRWYIVVIMFVMQFYFLMIAGASFWPAERLYNTRSLAVTGWRNPWRNNVFRYWLG